MATSSDVLPKYCLAASNDLTPLIKLKTWASIIQVMVGGVERAGGVRAGRGVRGEGM
jgi:hypothetical protein